MSESTNLAFKTSLYSIIHVESSSLPYHIIQDQKSFFHVLNAEDGCYGIAAVLIILILPDRRC